MKSRTILIVLALGLLVCLALLGVGLFFMRARMARAAEQPLVLITTPAHNQQVWIDRATPVLVTARSANGIARVELWANGQLQENRVAPQQELTTFSTAFVWQPRLPGSYTLIARAFDSDGNSGQATIAVQAVQDTPPNEPPVPPLSKGENLPGHSADPGSGPAGAAGGGAGAPTAPSLDEVEEVGGAADASGADAPDPDPAGPADDVVDIGPAARGGEVMLNLEVLGLGTEATYHTINCYFTVAGAETGQVIFGRGIMMPWEPTQPSAVTFPWPGDQPLPVRVECTGISPPAEGTPLGLPTEGEVQPAAWDGRWLRLESAGAFNFFFRIEVSSSLTSEDIPAPTNLRIEDVPLSPLKMLRWDWAGNEANIDGFRLYLNGSLQWGVADPSARFTYLPPEWVEPFCGQLHYLQVVAYQGPFPGGVESLPGDLAPLAPEAGRCGGVYRLTFESIDFVAIDYPTVLPETADVDGLIGPLYGWFGVDWMTLPFDTVQSDGASVAGIRVAGGEHFDLGSTFFGPSYRYHQDSIVMQWDNTLGGIGLHALLLDYDWGEGDSEDDFFCQGGILLFGPPPPDFTGVFNCVHTAGPTDVAQVTYHIEELPEWPEGAEPPPGFLPGAPRPELLMAGWELGPGGELLLYPINAGMAAAVPDLDLLVELDGATLGLYTIPSGSNPVAGEWDGRSSRFTLPDHTFASLADLCTLQVTVDPANRYLEYVEDNNTTTAADLDSGWVTEIQRPSTTSAALILSSEYLSCHGDPVGARVTPLLDGAEVAGFTVETVPIGYGRSWPVVANVTYTGAGPLTTTGWRLEMIDLSTSTAFFSEEITWTQEWAP